MTAAEGGFWRPTRASLMPEMMRWCAVDADEGDDGGVASV